MYAGCVGTLLINYSRINVRVKRDKHTNQQTDLDGPTDRGRDARPLFYAFRYKLVQCDKAIVDSNFAPVPPVESLRV